MAENRVHWDEDGILRVIWVGDQNETSAMEVAEETQRIASAVLGPINVLYDTTRAGKFSVAARQVAAASLGLLTQPFHGRVAIVASAMPMRALGFFMIGGAGVENARVFETQGEALEWLRRSPQQDKSFQRALKALFRVRWLRIKDKWLVDVFEVLRRVAMGDFSKRVTVSRHEDELALIEAGINLMADDLQDRQREAWEYEKRLWEQRNRIARELHDSVSQLLFSVVLNSEAAAALVESDPELARTRIKSVQAVAKEAQETMRHLLNDLRFGVVEQGLSAALNTYISMFKEREGIDTTFSVEWARPIAVSIGRELFRIAQEALNNIAKHSQATSARVELSFYPGLVRMKVEDNGIGFDPSNPSSEGLGLSSMRQRAEELGGSLAIESASGKGTKITVEVRA